ncbi:MAG: ribosome recycling factor [Candidatus Marinimicrobia bacterium]|nr:ribosome recycling factor [Candidatus Neomarinimicrobiota bacterium]MCF7827543.1 ribosome recycling factor [Candidatus Neomarinimicrobiota bacterium]MCF7881595.1 ribosome recycling factor [Candidatus Neomarinimicrobiota bacterium]
MIEEIYKDVEERMGKAVEKTRHDLMTVRTGRASTAILDGVKVDYYGSKTPLNQLAQLSAPEPRLLVIQPYEKNIIPDVERAILESDLGLNPQNDGTVIRLPIPELTKERREELTRYVHKLAEEGRIAIRNIRRDANETVKELEKEHEISEDNARRALETIQTYTDEHIKKIDEHLKHKESEIQE